MLHIINFIQLMYFLLDTAMIGSILKPNNLFKKGPEDAKFVYTFIRVARSFLC